MELVIYYSCPECSLIKIPCKVRAREDEDILTWMNLMGMTLSDDHRRRSPYCHPAELKDVMIPMTGASKVGGPCLD